MAQGRRCARQQRKGEGENMEWIAKLTDANIFCIVAVTVLHALLYNPIKDASIHRRGHQASAASPKYGSQG